MFLRRFAGPLLAQVKETTGIVGLEVVPNARELLISLYNKTLNEIKIIPENVPYRRHVEAFTNHRMKVCREEEDWETIEKRIACGQVEELIEDAESELQLIPKMAARKPTNRDNAGIFSLFPHVFEATQATASKSNAQYEKHCILSCGQQGLLS